MYQCSVLAFEIIIIAGVTVETAGSFGPLAFAVQLLNLPVAPDQVLFVSIDLTELIKILFVFFCCIR